jgi:hypothetical protein
VRPESKLSTARWWADGDTTLGTDLGVAAAGTDEVYAAMDWLDRVEVLSGAGAGQRRRQYGHWGRKRSEIEQEIIAWDPPRLLAWRHIAERLDGKPAPRFAASTEFQIQLAPAGQGTTVRLRSRQEPAGVLRALVMRLFGTRERGAPHGTLARPPGRGGGRGTPALRSSCRMIFGCGLLVLDWWSSGGGWGGPARALGG